MRNEYNQYTGNEFDTFLGVSLTQPILKNAGTKASRVNIRVAEKGSEIQYQTYRQRVMGIIHEAAKTYWDLKARQEIVNLRQNSVAIAERVLADNVQRVEAGKMPRTEVLEARAGVAQRLSLLSAGKRDFVDSMNRFRTYLSSLATQPGAGINATDALGAFSPVPNIEDGVQWAYKMLPQYLIAQEELEQSEIHIAFAENQRWPQLDLQASYGLNGIDIDAGDSLDLALKDNDRAWSLGLEFSVPLTGGKKTRSELTASQHKKRQALLRTKAMEVALTNAVSTAIESVNLRLDQAEQYGKIKTIDAELLNNELALLDAGKSNSRLVLDREEDLIIAVESELASLVEYQKSLLSLKLTQGTLLVDYGIFLTRSDR